MTEPRDRIDAWLEADVEPLSPRPGTFERVSRRARRRRWGQALLATAGTAMVIAAVVAVPRVTAALQPDRSVATGQPATRRQVGTPTAKAPSPSPTPKPAPGVIATLAPGGSGVRPAADFRATSVTFVGADGGTVGVALGQAGRPGSCGEQRHVCTSLAQTGNYGVSWSRASGPAAGPPDGPVGISQLRFLDLANGWAFGPQLFATHDGGASWAEINLPGRVIDLEAMGGRAFAMVARCTGTGSRYATGCTNVGLYSSPGFADRWELVSGASSGQPVSPGAIQLTSRRGYLLSGGRLATGPITGGAWHQVSDASQSTPKCLRGQAQPGWQPGTGLLAATVGKLYLTCTSDPAPGSPAAVHKLMLFTSADNGRTWQSDGPIAASGQAMSLTATTTGTVVLATSKCLYYTSPGVSWHSAAMAIRAPGGFSYVGMTNTTQGVAVPADPRLHVLVVTSDGGQSWQLSVIH